MAKRVPNNNGNKKRRNSSRKDYPTQTFKDCTITNMNYDCDVHNHNTSEEDIIGKYKCLNCRNIKTILTNNSPYAKQRLQSHETGKRCRRKDGTRQWRCLECRKTFGFTKYRAIDSHYRDHRHSDDSEEEQVEGKEDAPVDDNDDEGPAAPAAPAVEGPAAPADEGPVAPVAPAAPDTEEENKIVNKNDENKNVDEDESGDEEMGYTMG